MKAPRPGIYRKEAREILTKTSRDLEKLPVILIETQNLTEEERKVLEKTVRNLERKRSSSKQPRLNHIIRHLTK